MKVQALFSNDKKITCLIFEMYKLLVLLSSFGLFLPIFSVMMPASLLRKRTKTSPKYEQTEAFYFFHHYLKSQHTSKSPFYGREEKYNK